MTSTTRGDAFRRLAFLDLVRALAVLGMLLGNMVNVFLVRRPRWLGHNLGDELHLLDLPAPVFQFLIGVSLALFLARHGHRENVASSRWRAARRFVMLIVLGLALDGLHEALPGGGAVGRLELRWGVLQTLGFGGLVATALADLSDAAIVAIAAAITTVHYGPGNNQVHRSVLDCLPFVPLSLLGLVVGRPLARGDGEGFRRRAALAGAACVALAVALRLGGIPFNKLTGSSSFVLLAASVAATTLAALADMETRGRVFWPPLTTLGANALTTWVLQYLVIYYPAAWLAGGKLALPWLVGMPALTAAVIALTVLTLALARRGVRVPL